MSEWTEVAKQGDIAPGQARAVEIDGRMIAVVNLDGEFHAIDNICTHAYALLTDGPIVGCEIQCPLHAARFDIRTGAVTAPPAYEALEVYEVRLDGDAVLVKV